MMASVAANPIVVASIISATGAVIAAAMGVVNNSLVRRQHKETTRAVDTLTKQTNGISERLVATTALAEHASGKLEGIAEQAARGAAEITAAACGRPAGECPLKGG